MGEVLKLLEHCPEAVRANIRRLWIEPGEYIFRQGDRVKELYFLLSGQAENYVVTPSGVDYRVGITGEDEMYGDFEIFHGYPVTYNVRAITRCEVLKTDLATLTEWLNTDREFSHFFYMQLTSKIYNTNMRAITYITYPLRYCVEFFLWNRTKAGQRYIEKNDIVRGIGSQIRSVNRILRTLIDEEVVECDGGIVKVLSPETLQEDMRRQEKAAE